MQKPHNPNLIIHPHNINVSIQSEPIKMVEFDSEMVEELEENFIEEKKEFALDIITQFFDELDTLPPLEVLDRLKQFMTSPLRAMKKGISISKVMENRAWEERSAHSDIALLSNHNCEALSVQQLQKTEELLIDLMGYVETNGMAPEGLLARINHELINLSE